MIDKATQGDWEERRVILWYGSSKGETRGRRICEFLAILALNAFFLHLPSVANAQAITVAGFAFGGQEIDAKDRFRWSHQVIEKLQTPRVSGASALSKKVVDTARAVKNPKVEFDFSQSLKSLRASDQALLVVLALTNETLLVEKFDSHYKIFASLQAEAMLIDLKSQTIIRSYPINVALFDAAAAAPSDEHLRGLISKLLLADDSKSLLHQFSRRLEVLTVPSPGTKTVQVKKTEISEDALKLFPERLRNVAAATNALAEQFSSVLSFRTGVPLLPSKVGHVTGVMHVRFEDQYDFELRIPDGDYVFDIQLKRLAKIQHAKNNVGASYVYGAFIQIAFGDPQLGPPFLSAEFKNGEVAVVPAGREMSEDFPAYQDAIQGLFTKFSEAITGVESRWLRSATGAPDIQNQIGKTKTILESCKK